MKSTSDVLLFQFHTTMNGTSIEIRHSFLNPAQVRAATHTPVHGAANLSIRVTLPHGQGAGLGC